LATEKKERGAITHGYEFGPRFRQKASKKHTVNEATEKKEKSRAKDVNVNRKQAEGGRDSRPATRECD